MKNKLLIAAAALMILSAADVFACTNIIVTKDASADGSTMVSYAADSHWLYGELYLRPAGTFKEKAMRQVIEWDTYKPLGKIPEATQTYQRLGNMNEHQLIIGETTWGGREEQINEGGLMDYGSLIYIALERAKSAREAIKVIAELDEGMRKQFAEKFAEIGKEFDKVFQELFGGGKGTLELMEDEDILDAGIRIISQPPGKKLQNMMQLSGGEKALTAIALMFAIQNLKPSPFCLLDEIEAALDDSNVGRFAGYLHKLTKTTQFIVITHRRGTMTSADRLYGITMQEKGVSTLVSVNLVESALS